MENKKDWKLAFFAVWLGQNFSILGSSLVHFALVWWMTQETDSAKVLAIAVAITYIPRIFLGPFLGALIDRLNRRKVLIFSDGFIAVVTLGLMYLFWIGQVQIWHLYVVVFLRSLGEAIHWPTMLATTPLMVPEKHLSRINGLNQVLQGGLNIAAPPLGALLLSMLPMHGVISVEIVTALAAIIPLCIIRIPQPAASAASSAPRLVNLWAEVKEALHNLFSLPGMGLITCVSVMMNFLMTPVFSLLPLLVTRHFGGGVWHLSVIESAFGVGLITGGVLMSVWGGFKSKVLTLISGVFGIGIGVLVLGVLPSNMFLLGVVGMFIGCVANSMCNAVLFSILQTRIPHEMQGRIFSIIMSLSGMMAPLGLLVSAPLSEHIGIEFWYVMSGSVILTVAMIMRLSRKVMASMEGLDAPAKPVLSEVVSLGHAGN